jgi:hypothetical protein
MHRGSTKGHIIMLRYGLIVLAGLFLRAPTALAGSWADAMFEELSKDFGSVARGPALAHPFRLTNNTGKPVHIWSVRVSCGCTTAFATKSDLEPGESTTIEAHMDTRRFLGVKNVTIYVQFDQPHWEEVRLWVQANSRDDISVTPEAFTLGQARRGTIPSGTITVTFLGNGQSAITQVERESNYIQTALKEVRRDADSVAYQLTATIRADVPVGKWYSDIWLQTNDPAMPRVRVPLTVEIESALSLSPSVVNLGQVKSGAEAQRKVIVRGTKPFRVTKVQGMDDQLSVKDSTSESKPVHVLTVTLKPAKTGDLSRKLRVITDLKEEGEVEFEAKAQVTQ